MPTKIERLRKIVNWVNAEGDLSIKELSSRLNVSGMTIWRDLEELDQAGEICRVRGGATKSKEPVATEPLFSVKTVIHHEEKSNIARYAATQLVAKDQIIILEGGTTVRTMLDYLDHPNLTVLTHGLNTLIAASHRLHTLSVMSCGGMLRPKSLTFVGPQAEAYFENFHADTFFLGATGIDLEEGITDPNPLEIQIKRAMHRAARRTVLLIDSSKFGRRSLTRILPLDEIDALVTDSNAPADMLDELRSIGIEIHVASSNDARSR